MLYHFIKYKNHNRFCIDLNYCSRFFLTTTRDCIFKKVSPFFRKMFFRTLLIYINIIYCNFFSSGDKNFFYYVSFIFVNYSFYHPGFYYKYKYVA